MNKMHSSLLLVGLLLSLNFQLWANDLVRFPVGPAAWTIDVTASPTSNPPIKLGGVAITKVEVTQNEQVSRNLVTYFTGQSRVSWTIAGTSLILTQDSNGTAFLTSASNIYSVPYEPSIFGWVNPGLLKEKKPIDYQGKACFHYQETVTSPSPNGIGSHTQNHEAWIDSKTLRPVALDNGITLVTFTFLPTPTAPLVMPEKFKKILDGYTAVMGIHRSQ